MKCLTQFPAAGRGVKHHVYSRMKCLTQFLAAERWGSSRWWRWSWTSEGRWSCGCRCWLSVQRWWSAGGTTSHHWRSWRCSVHSPGGVSYGVWTGVTQHEQVQHRCEQVWHIVNKCDTVWTDVAQSNRCDTVWTGVTHYDRCDTVWTGTTQYDRCDTVWTGTTQYDRCDTAWTDATQYDRCDTEWTGTAQCGYIIITAYLIHPISQQSGALQMRL